MSKVQSNYVSVQSINQTKNIFDFSIFKKIKTIFQHKTAPYLFMFSEFHKKSAVRVYQFLAIVTIAAVFSSCQKQEISTPALSRTSLDNLSSLANTSSLTVDAGSVRRIVYPSASTATLYGSGSSTLGAVTYLWKQVRGNSTATIAQPKLATTDVSNLKPGLYTFTLTVTDSKSVSRIDSTSVTVLEKKTWNIGGVTREALVHPATGGSGQPAVIIAFHGHGGSDLGFAERGFELSWPEAIVVYPQGLPTVSRGDKGGSSTGWQHSVGEVNNKTGDADQDLKFFDAMLSTFQKNYNANMSQIFVHGWSNGGEFVYDVLWSARGDKLAALSPAAATLGTTSGKKPLPVIHVAGTSDQNMKFSNQQQSVQSVRTLDKCSSTGTAWATGANGLLGTHYSSSINDPVVSLQYNGGHSYPFTVPPYIVKFFKEVAGL